MAHVAKFFILKKMFIAERNVSACDRVKRHRLQCCELSTCADKLRKSGWTARESREAGEVLVRAWCTGCSLACVKYAASSAVRFGSSFISFASAPSAAPRCTPCKQAAERRRQGQNTATCPTSVGVWA